MVQLITVDPYITHTQWIGRTNSVSLFPQRIGRGTGSFFRLCSMNWPSTLDSKYNQAPLSVSWVCKSFISTPQDLAKPSAALVALP